MAGTIIAHYQFSWFEFIGANIMITSSNEKFELGTVLKSNKFSIKIISNATQEEFLEEHKNINNIKESKEYNCKYFYFVELDGIDISELIKDVKKRQSEIN